IVLSSLEAAVPTSVSCPAVRADPRRAGCRPSHPPDLLPERDRVVHRGAAPVVVEVDEHVLVVEAAGDPLGPGAERVPVVVRGRLRVPVMEPEVAPARGAPERTERGAGP